MDIPYNDLRLPPPPINISRAPMVSVLFPVYNTKESYLREAIESILGQTYTNFELLILDDGSTQNHVEEVVRSYDDSRIYYHQYTHKGLVPILNAGIRLACGKYIARMDSDDIAHPERFAKQVEFLESHPDISIVGTAMEIFPKGKIVYTEQKPTLFSFLQGIPFFHPTVMWRREDFEKHNLYYDERYQHCEDYELWFRVLCNLKMYNLRDVLLRYRAHSDSVCANYREIQLQRGEEIKQRLLALCTHDVKEQEALLRFVEKGYNFPSALAKKNGLFGVVVYKECIRIFFLGIRIYKIPIKD